MKKSPLFAFRVLGVACLLGACVSCESTGKPKKPKPVPPSAGIDEKPWNRPHAWENNARYGNMLPQGR